MGSKVEGVEDFEYVQHVDDNSDEETEEEAKTESFKDNGNAPRKHDENEDDVYEIGDDEADVKQLRVGDYISLRSLPTSQRSKGGFISAEGVLDDNCVVDERPNMFDECVFQICIQHQYSALKEYEENLSNLEDLHSLQEEYQAQVEATEKDQNERRVSTVSTTSTTEQKNCDPETCGHENALSSLESDIAKLTKLAGSLKRAMDNEQTLNRSYQKTSIGRPVFYGDVIQLLHMKSQKFLTVESNQVAALERENLRVALSEYGSAHSWFTVAPAFKIEREGDACNSGASIVLQVSERSGEQIHCSHLPLRKGAAAHDVPATNTSASTTHNINNEPSYFREVNCSLERTVWRAVLYDEYHDGTDKSVHCGELIRLIEPELNAYLRVVHARQLKRSMCVLTPLDEAALHGHYDSNSLWVVEGFRKPAAGGALIYAELYSKESRSYRLRHLNTGKYLALQSNQHWRGSIKLDLTNTDIVEEDTIIVATKKLNSKEDRIVHEFCAQDSVLAANCAVYLFQPQVAGQRKAKPGSASKKLRSLKAQYIQEASPVQLQCRGRWMQCGHELCETSTDIICTGEGSRTSALSLVLERAVTDTKQDHSNNLLVGVAAIPRLEGIVFKLHDVRNDASTKLREILSVETAFNETLDQLVSFMLGRSLEESPDYSSLEEALVHELPYDRQMLLCEQGVLTTLINIIRHLDTLAREIIAKDGKNIESTYENVVRNQAARNKRRFGRGKKRVAAGPQSELDEVITLQSDVGMRAFWILVLATRNNKHNQMHVGDFLHVFIPYSLREPIAAEFLGHMLRTNITLQETKVTDIHANLVVRLIREQHMHASHLDMLRALCSCNGRGVGSNQCRVVDLWFKGAEDLLIKLVVSPNDDGQVMATWTLGSPDGFPKPPEALLQYVHGADLYKKNNIPKLYLTWNTSRSNFSPRDFGAEAGTNLVPVISIFTNEKRTRKSLANLQFVTRDTVSRFFIAQLYLIAELCLDRNYLAIQLAEQAVPFHACLALIQHFKVPNNLKAAVVRIITTVYVDKDPSKKSVVPHLAHNWHDVAAHRNSARPNLVDGQRISFVLLQDLIDQYLVKMSNGNSWDALKQRMMELLLKLVQFSYYSTTTEMQRLVRPLVKDLCNQCIDRSEQSADTKRSKAGRGASFRSKKKGANDRRVFPTNCGIDLDTDSKYFMVSLRTRARDFCLSRMTRCGFRNFQLQAHPHSWQSIVYDIMDSIGFVMIVLAIVIVMLVFWALGTEDITLQGAPGGYTGTTVTSLILTVTLIFEVLFRWYCYMHKFGRFWYFVYDPESFPFNIIDILLASLDMLLILGIFSASKGFKLGKVLRIIKLVRAVRAAKAIHKLSEKPEEIPEPDWIMPTRYLTTPQQRIATMRELVTVLGEVSLLHRDCNLAAFIAKFKQAYKTGEGLEDPFQLFCEIVDQSPKLATLAAPVLEERRGAGSVSNRFDEILLDLCLYNDSELVQCALNLLMVQHSARDSLFTDISATQLICGMEEERKCKRLRSILMELQSMAEQHELWGQLETEDNKATYNKVIATLNELTDACIGPCGSLHGDCAFEVLPHMQTLLANLGALETAISVMELHTEMDEVSEDIGNSIVYMLRLCCIFLRWFVKGHDSNQVACFEYLDIFVECFQYDCLAPCVIAEIVHGNTELTKAFPSKVIVECGNRIFTGGQNYTYLQLMKALLWIGGDEKESGKSVQFEVLRELTIATRAKKTLWLCVDPDGDDYGRRLTLMNEEQVAMENARNQRVAQCEFKTPDMDYTYAPPLLRYHCTLIDTLAACALGADNITTVEAKLQLLFPPDMILTSLIDERVTLTTRVSLVRMLLNTVIEVEIAVPEFEKNVNFWKFLLTVPTALQKAAICLQQNPSVWTETGPNGIETRFTLRYAFLCAKVIKLFLERYLIGTGTMKEVKESPTMSLELEDLVKKNLTEYKKQFPIECLPARRASSLPNERQDSAGSIMSMALSHLESGSMRSLPIPPTEEGESSPDISPRSMPDDSSPRSIASDQQQKKKCISTAAATPTNDDRWLAQLLSALHSALRTFYISNEDQSILSYENQEVIYKSLEVLIQRARLDLDEERQVEPPVRTVAKDEPSIDENKDHGPKLAFDHFIHDLAGSENMQQCDNADKDGIIASFEMLKSQFDPWAKSELRIEPLIEKLVAHTLNRMKPSLKGRKLDADCTKTTRWLVQVFRVMIEKKWGMTIDERDDDGGEEQDAAVQDLQLMLNRCGVTKLCLMLIAPGIERDLVLEATRLCVALLFHEGGNREIQIEIHRILSAEPEMFFRGVRNTLTEIRNTFMFNEIPMYRDPEDEPEIPTECITMRLLQLMSEGHYEPNQNIMREQPGFSSQVNLLDDMVELLSALSRDKRRCRCSTKAALQASSTLLEFIQGPCKQNQMHLAIHTELIEILNRITRSKPIRDCDPDEDDQVKKMALEIYEGLLEGETGESVVITRIISVVDLNVLKAIIEQEDPNAKADELNEIQIECLVLLQMFLDFKPSLRESVQLSPRVQRLMGKRVTSVEVVWHGMVIRRFFPIPQICEHISEATRQKLVTDIDRSSDEVRLQDFLRRAHDIYREISHHAVLEDVRIGNFNLAQIFSRTNQEYATWLAFVVAFIINTILILYAEHRKRDNDDASDFLSDGSPSMWHGGRTQIRVLLLVLNVFNIGLSSFTLILFIVVRCPVKYLTLSAKGHGKLSALALTTLDHMTVYYLVYTILAALALEYRFCSSLLLLDIIVKDATSADVINAIVYPRKQLFATMMLGTITIYIFSVLIFENYAATFTYDDSLEEDEYPEDCRSLVRCFAVTAMYGLRLSGGIGDIMSHTWSSRLWLDFLYFFIVLVVLLNVVFGVIIDTFSELRTRKKDRLRNTLGNCFICGLGNMTFDRIAPGGFRRHIHNDHYMWNYLNFIIFIWQQDKDEDDGLELHVRKQIEKLDIGWLPVGRALCLSQKKTEATMEEQISTLRQSLDTTIATNEKHVVKSFMESTELLRQMIDETSHKYNRRIEELEARLEQGGVIHGHTDHNMSTNSLLLDMPPSSPVHSPQHRRIGNRIDDNESKPRLVVSIHGASGLVDTHLLGSATPYVFARAVLSTTGHILGETDRIYFSPAVQWPEGRMLTYANPQANASVCIEIWHCTKQGQGHFLGQAIIPWSDIMAGGRRTLDLQRKPGGRRQLFVQGKVHATVTLQSSAASEPF